MYFTVSSLYSLTTPLDNPFIAAALYLKILTVSWAESRFAAVLGVASMVFLRLFWSIVFFLLALYIFCPIFMDVALLFCPLDFLRLIVKSIVY